MERICQKAADYESASNKPGKDILLIRDCREAVQAIQDGEHIQIVPMPQFVPPEMQEYAEPKARAMQDGSPEYWATRWDNMPKDSEGRAFIELYLVASNERRQKLLELYADRWKEQLTKGRALQQHVTGGPVTEYSEAVIVGETNREIRLKEIGRL